MPTIKVPYVSDEFYFVSCNAREEWLAERRKYITASDCYDAINNPLAVYVKKLVDLQFEPTERMEFGAKVETIVREIYVSKTGRPVYYPGPHVLAVSKKYPWLACSLDGLIVDGNCVAGLPLGVYEGKANTVFRAHEWDGDVPERYKWQGMAAMAVTGLPYCGFACLLDMEVVANDVHRNDAAVEFLLERTLDLWNRIEAKEPPPVNGTEVTAKALKALYPDDNGATVELPELQAHSYYQKLCDLKEEIKTLEGESQAIENWFRAEIGDATFGVFADKQASLKTTVRKAYEVAESKYRQLRFKVEQ